MKKLTLLIAMLMATSAWAEDDFLSVEDIPFCDNEEDISSWIFCTYHWTDGVYTGEWNNNSNFASFTFTDGTTYLGEFDSEYQFHGEGVMTLPNGKVYSGKWVHNELNGEDIQKLYKYEKKCDFICGDGKIYRSSCGNGFIIINNRQCQKKLLQEPRNKNPSTVSSDWIDLYKSLRGLASIKNEIELKKREKAKREVELRRAYRKGLNVGKRRKKKN